MSIVAERPFTSRMTVHRIEVGDPSVGIGLYAAVLQALGLLEGFGRGVGPSEMTWAKRSHAVRFQSGFDSKANVPSRSTPDIEVYWTSTVTRNRSACFDCRRATVPKPESSNMTTAG